MSKSQRTTNQIVRLIILSDTHGHHDLLHSASCKLPKGDILIHCGDFTDKGSYHHAERFVEWFDNLQGFDEKIVIDGNHDRNLYDPSVLDLKSLFRKREDTIEGNKNGEVVFLQDELYKSPKFDLRIYGASWKTCEEGNLCNHLEPIYNSHDNAQITAMQSDFSNELNNDQALKERNPKIDILLTHLNPYIDATTLTKNKSMLSPMAWMYGSVDIIEAINMYQTPLCLCGHVHWGRGILRLKHELQQPQLDRNAEEKESVIINASSLWPGHFGIGVSKPIIIDYDLHSRSISWIDFTPHPESSWYY